MRKLHRIPDHAAAHADIFGRSKLETGEQVIDTGVHTDDLARGTLVLRETTVRGMCGKLGLQILEGDLADEFEALRIEVAELRIIAEKYNTIQGALTDG